MLFGVINSGMEHAPYMIPILCYGACEKLKFRLPNHFLYAIFVILIFFQNWMKLVGSSNKLQFIVC